MAAHLITYALALGAVLRLSRLVVDDDITAPLRGSIHRAARKPDGTPRRLLSFTARLISCTWCTSMWVAAGVTAAAVVLGDTLWFRAPAMVLTLSWLAGILTSWLDSPPPARHVVHHAPDPVQLRVTTKTADVPGQMTG
ncbi:DUF1360 domain-containing protein [Streptomyces sp. NPDC101213]|uniref:DUF1360 domain-containing protein n=1 Tax=Streptomyces sp. NPDC101213 TaxID=3366130 RepID=UPI00380D3614